MVDMGVWYIMASNKKIRPFCYILKSIEIISPEDITFFGFRWLMRDRVESYFRRCDECRRILCPYFRGLYLSTGQQPSFSDIKFVIENYLPTLSKKYSVWRGINLGRDVALNDIYISHSLYNSSTNSSKKVLSKDDELLNNLLSDIYVFSWDEIPGSGDERLIEYLIQKIGIDWAKNALIEKIDDDKVVKVYTKKNSLSIKLYDEKNEALLQIDDGRKIKLIAKRKNNELNIYSNDNSDKRILIYGYAGSGKTTLLRRWTLNISIFATDRINKLLMANENLSSESIENRVTINSIPLIPIYLSMGEIGQKCGGESSWNASIPELAAMQYSNSKEQSRLLMKSLTAFTNSGKSIILLDAADEVPKEAQPQIKNWLEKVKVSSKCPVILTSRPYCEYISELSNFDAYNIEEFDTSQIKEFIKKWFNKSPDQGAINTQDLINKLDSSKMLGNMAKNPLFLTMMCIDFEVHGKIDSRSPGELFYQFVCILLVHWDRERGVKRQNARTIPTSINIELDILGYIASMFNRQIDIPVYDLLKYIQTLDAMKNISIDADDIIKDIESTSGILIYARPGFYRFCHSLFRDFFYAFNIVVRVKKGEIDWGEWSKEHYWDLEFQNINAFFIELMEMEE